MIYGRGDQRNPTVSSRENGLPVLLESFAGWAKEGDGQSFTVQQFCANTLWSDSVLFLLDLQTNVASMVAFVVQTADKPDLPLVVFGGSLKQPARARQGGGLNLSPARENVTVTSASCWRMSPKLDCGGFCVFREEFHCCLGTQIIVTALPRWHRWTC